MAPAAPAVRPLSTGAHAAVDEDARRISQHAWSLDGKTIVVTRGSGASVHGRTVAANQFYQFVKVPAEGGDVKAIVTVNRPYMAGRPVMPRRPIPQAHLVPTDGCSIRRRSVRRLERRRRIAPEIVSVDLEGRDRPVHVVLNDADEAAVSPDGQQLAFQEGDNVYLMAFHDARHGREAGAHRQAQGPPAGDADFDRGRQFPALARQQDRRVRERPRHYAYDIETKTDRGERDRLSLPRQAGKGSVAFTNARLLTMDNRKVIERGALVIKTAASVAWARARRAASTR